MAIPRYIFSELAEILLTANAVKATKYFNEREVAKAKRVTYQGKINKRYCRTHIVFTIGSPNYEEKQHIKMLKKLKLDIAKEKIQIKYPKQGR